MSATIPARVVTMADGSVWHVCPQCLAGHKQAVAKDGKAEADGFGSVSSGEPSER